MDGAVKGDEAYLCPRVSRKPRVQTHAHVNKTSTQYEVMLLLLFYFTLYAMKQFAFILFLAEIFI